MLEKVTIRRFKRFEDITIELGNPVVFIGPNNSGKTSALQALALWALGVRKWSERRSGGNATKRTGVSINRREIINIPIRNSYSLWRSLQVRKGNNIVRIEIFVEGTSSAGAAWTLGMAFESVDADNIRCRPIGESGEDKPPQIPEGAREVNIASLPPMSGLASQEDLLQPGSIDRRIGEGRTSDVLRNLCYLLYKDHPESWQHLVEQMKNLFGATLQDPDYTPETGTLSLEYVEGNTHFDLLSAGQGFRQTLLLLAYMYNNPKTVLLLDEPDAHLEILRQRQIYQVLSSVGGASGGQVVIATHSEIILNEAAGRDIVIAFIGQPKAIRREAEIRKALADYGFEDYTQAEQTGWVLYLEGSTDYAILKQLAHKLKHPATQALERVFVRYVENQPNKAIEHFKAIQFAFPDMVGLALFDQYGRGLPTDVPHGLTFAQWQRRELENYIVTPQTLLDWAAEGAIEDLFGMARKKMMQEVIDDVIPRIALNNPNDRWWSSQKMSDDVLDRIFELYHQKTGESDRFNKGSYYKLVPYLPIEAILPEVTEKLDAIYAVFEASKQHKELNDLGMNEDV